MPDLPLAGPISQHHRSGATITHLARELDMAKKDKLGGKNATYGIYGYCDFVPSKETRGHGSTRN